MFRIVPSRASVTPLPCGSLREQFPAAADALGDHGEADGPPSL
jgi:hypothetical protein